MRRAVWVLLWATLWVGCSAGQQAEYDAAQTELLQWEQQVDDGFAQAQALNPEIFLVASWDDGPALAARLQAAHTAMGQVVADQRSRIDVEVRVLQLELMDNAPSTRELYHLDIAAQRAKLGVFTLSLEMYERLQVAQAARDRAAYAALLQRYRSDIDGANRHYQELDLARQHRQGSVPDTSGKAI